MKIAQIIPCLGRNSGGPSRSVPEMNRGLLEIGVDSEIITNNYSFNPNVIDEKWIRALSCSKVGWHEYNPAYKYFLKQIVANHEYDLYHIHSIYSYPTTIASRLFRKNKVPFIIAPRGSLFASAIDVSSRRMKQLFNRFYLINDLNHASVIHATCVEEMEAIRRIGVKAPIAIISNSISLPKERPIIKNNTIFRACFLGRISPQKNIVSLLKAWNVAGLGRDKTCELLIIGPAQTDKDKKYLEQLKILERELKIENIHWIGSKSGAEKEALLQMCSFLILPSFSENFGMVVLEALKLGIPVLASEGTPWQVLEEAHCGWWFRNNIETLAIYLSRIRNISIEERMLMGMNGQQLVWEKFSTPAISMKLKRLYEWILKGGEKPEFVFLR